MSSMNAFSLLQGSESESVDQLAKKVEKQKSLKKPQTNQTQDKNGPQANKPKRDNQLGGTRGRGRGASRGASRGGPRGGQRGGFRGGARGRYVNNRGPTEEGAPIEGEFSGRGRGSRGRGRGGYVPSKNVRPFDRSVSRTGRGKELQKGGAGKNNWGAEVDPDLEHASTEEAQQVLATVGETAEEPSSETKTTEETTETKEEQPKEVKKTKEEEEEEKQRSYEQFLKEQEDNKKRLMDIKNKFNKTKREPKNYDKSVLVQGTNKVKEEQTFIKLSSEKPKTESQKQESDKTKQAKKKSVSNAEFFSGVEMGRKPRGEYRGEFRGEFRGGFRGRGNTRGGRGASTGRGRGRGKNPRGPKINDDRAFPKL